MRHRGMNRRMRCNTADLRDLFRVLGCWQQSAVARFSPLRYLQFYHLHSRLFCIPFEMLQTEGANRIPASEISGTDLPYQIPTHFVVRTDTSFSGIMGE